MHNFFLNSISKLSMSHWILVFWTHFELLDGRDGVVVAVLVRRLVAEQRFPSAGDELERAPVVAARRVRVAPPADHRVDRVGPVAFRRRGRRVAHLTRKISSIFLRFKFANPSISQQCQFGIQFPADEKESSETPKIKNANQQSLRRGLCCFLKGKMSPVIQI